MADELTLNATLAYDDSGSPEQTFQITDLLASVATLKFVRVKQQIGTTEEALVLGEATSPGWFICKNLDTTNYVEIRVATAGARFAKLLPGEFCFLRLASGAQAPFAIANTAACYVEYFIAMT